MGVVQSSYSTYHSCTEMWASLKAHKAHTTPIIHIQTCVNTRPHHHTSLSHTNTCPHLTTPLSVTLPHDNILPHLSATPPLHDHTTTCHPHHTSLSPAELRSRSTTCRRPFPTMPKYCAVATATRSPSKGLNSTCHKRTNRSQGNAHTWHAKERGRG